jgi:hypothetical protein
MWFIKTIVVIVVFLVGITFFTLQRNGANLTEPPGFSKRLAVFLKTHSAATSDDPYLPELRTPVFDMTEEELFKYVLEFTSRSGWSILAHDSDKKTINLVVRSPVFLFEDDVYVEVRPVDAKRSSLYIESNSRSGGADFAANSGHIQKLIDELKNR